ncbi:MAG: DUF72 domain-containing protein [Patescibacteria group bacterium]
MILVGTSGFSYADWVGPFYPPGTRREEMLPYYAARFPLVELDFTYYRMPSARALAGMAAKTPGGFLFCVKTHQDLTHRRDITKSELAALAAQFIKGITPLCEAGKLGCILAQFPWAFKSTSENFEYLAALQAHLAGLPVVVEFRNAEWVKDETFSFLRDFGLGFCCVDEPRLRGLFPPLAVATSEIGYLRFHGRNAAKWWRHEYAWERYDYDYSQAELEEWLPKMEDLNRNTTRTFVLMNNCHAGHAVRNALRLQALLAGEDSG